MENKDNMNVQTEKKKVRKIGRLTFGITLILVGLSVVIQTFLPIEIFRYILMLWPLVFISIGIEVIYFSKKEEIKYDGVGIFLIFVVLFFGTIFGAINYGVNKILYNDNMKNYIAEELNDSVVNYTFSPKIKINNYSDKKIDVEIIEQEDIQNTKVIAKATYIGSDKLNMLSYIREEYNLHSIIDYTLFEDYEYTKKESKENQDIIEISNIPSFIENLKIKVITNNKDNVKLEGNINLI